MASKERKLPLLSMLRSLANDMVAPFKENFSLYQSSARFAKRGGFASLHHMMSAPFNDNESRA
jgi:hypothetical protein